MSIDAYAQIIANDRDYVKKIIDINSYDYYTYKPIELVDSNTEKCPITSLCDVIIPEFLELEFVDPSNSHNIDNVKKLVLNLKIGNNIVQQFYLSLLVNLKEPIILDNRMYINLCFDMFFGDIKITGLQYNKIEFELINIEPGFIVDYGIVSNLVFVDEEMRRKIFNIPSKTPIQQLSKNDIEKIEPSDNYNIVLIFDGITKGLFIECDDVDNLNSVVIKFNSCVRFVLDHSLLKIKCIKISNNVLYIPFNYDKNYRDRTFESYEGSANLTAITNIKIILNFNTINNHINIYSLFLNIFKMCHGMSVTEFYFNNYIDLSNSSTIKKKIINEEKLICPIMFEPIKNGDKYMICSTCNNNFNEKAINQLLEKYKKTCPVCRHTWNNFVIYINEI